MFPLRSLLEEVEEQTGVRFYFLENWIRGVRVTASGEAISLRRTLDKTLLPAGLYYHLEEGRLDLPYPIAGLVSADCPITRDPGKSGSASGGKTPGLTSTEQRYIDGRKAGMLETLSGWDTGQKEGGNNVAVLHGKIYRSGDR